MKPATVAFRTLLQEGTSVKALPKLYAEWDHNRYSQIESVTVSPVNSTSDWEWNGIYDLDSIALPNRPQTGIAKARLSESITLQSGYRDKPQQARFYAASASDPYKYWSSNSRTKLAPVATNEYDFPSPITLTLLYEDVVIGNKIVVGFETSYARPKSFDIQITENGTTWKTVSSSPVPNPTTGQVVLWRKSDNSETWGNVPVYDGPMWIKGVRLVVRSMTEGYSNLDVIQMGARLENDLSDFVIDYDRDFEVSERSLIAPLGKASSNTASVQLTNLDLRFNNNNVDSIYYGLIDKKVKFTLELSVDVRPAGSADERFREFTMYADSWGGQDEDSVTVQLKDSSIFLQEMDMPKVFWENLTVGAIIWQIMDTFGMTNYNYTRDTLDTGQVVPYFWAIDGTAWEQISRLAEGTQTAVWFDEYDVMQIKTRKALFGPNKTVSWNFDAVQNGKKKPDIISMASGDDLVVNHVDINWKPAEFREGKSGLPVMETVWEPENETVLLRASSLTQDFLTTHDVLNINPEQSTTWPFESLINIRGEILRYKGKEYKSYIPGGGWKFTWVESQDQKDEIDAASDPNIVWANAFTGRLKVAERGIAGSGTANHVVRSINYFGLVTSHTGDRLYSWNSGMSVSNGVLTLMPHGGVLPHEIYISGPSVNVPANNTNYGCRLRIPSQNIQGNGWAIGGLHFAGDTGDYAYYALVSTTAHIDGIEARAHRHEISLYGGGIGDSPLFKIADVPAAIFPDVWYDLEVRHIILSPSSRMVSIFLDGVQVMQLNLGPNHIWNGPETGNFAVVTQGQGKVEYDYLYAVYQEDQPEPDKSTFLDLTTGGFTSGFIERQWRYGDYWQTYGTGMREAGGRLISNLLSRSNYFYDEFGPVVHEMREFDIQFNEDDVPVAHSYPFLSNSSQVVCTDYNSDAFGARFTLANASYRDAIIKGEDAITLGSEHKIDQKFFIYGRKLFQEEENTTTKKDDFSIRRKGPVTLTFDNQWVQTEGAANELGQWVVDMWGGGSDEISLDVFGNPLIQIGDLVTVNYPVKDMVPNTHKYYVVSVSNKFDAGLETTLILRRSRV